MVEEEKGENHQTSLFVIRWMDKKQPYCSCFSMHAMQVGLENPPHTTDCMNRWTQRINTDIFVLHEIYQTNPKIAQASLRLFPFSRELKEYARQKI